MTGTFDAGVGRVRYLHALRTHWLLVAAITVAAVGVAAAVVTTATKRYDANADLQIQALPAYGQDVFQSFDVFRQPTDGSSPAVTAARMFSAPQYHDLLRRRLGTRTDGVSVAVTPLSQGDLVSIAADAPSGSLAAAAANRYAAAVVAARKQRFQQQLHQRIKQVELQIAAIPKAGRATNPTYATLAGQVGTLRSWLGSPDPTVRLLTRATVPLAPSWPRPKTTLAVALLVGLLLGAAAAVGLELVNPRVTREDELTLAHRLPVLARVPRLPAKTVHDYLMGRSLLPAAAWKGYRTFRAVLGRTGIDGDFPRTVLVTSASPGDGKTMTAVNLAIALAASELRVTLVDADFHRPMVGTIFNVTARRDGLVRLLADPDGPGAATVEAPTHHRLRLLLSSREQLHQLHLFDTRRIERVLERLHEESDVVIIDSPPLPEVAEALALADAAEAVVVCVRVGHTRRDKLNELRNLLAQRAITPLGFFVTTRRRAQPDVSDYDYSTGVATTPSGSLVAEDPIARSEAS